MSSSKGRKPRSKSQDGSIATTTTTMTAASKEKKTRSKSHDDANSGVRKQKSTTARRSGSLKKSSTGPGSSSGGFSLEDGLSKVAAAPSLFVRQNRGDNNDDEDTFCGTGTVDGEVKSGKLRIKNTKNIRPANPFGIGRSGGRAPAADPFGGKSAFGFGSNNNNDDDDSEEDDDIDFFAGASNPFKELKKKRPTKRTVL